LWGVIFLGDRHIPSVVVVVVVEAAAAAVVVMVRG
jgi:hypothetical protein